MPLKLEVPPISQDRNLTAETRPRHVKDWLDRLPLANVPESARQITAALGTINRQEVGDDARLKLLALYCPVIEHLVAAIRRQLVSAPLPLSDRHRQAAYLARQMLTELGYGYKIVLMRVAERRFGFGLGRNLAESVARTLACFEEVLGICYETYAPIPAGLWTEVYQVFQVALRNRVENEAVVNGSDTTTPANIFRRIVLLTVADPYHLMHGEVARTQEYLRRFAPHTTLHPVAEVANSAGMFLVRLRSDKAPRPFGQEPSRDRRGDIVLGAFELARTAHDHARRLRRGDSPGAIGLHDSASDPAYPDLLRRLVRSWGLAPKRQHTRRLNVGQMLQLCAGLRGLQFALGKKAGDAKPDSSGNEEITIEAGSALADPAGGPFGTLTDWELVNDSTSGMALKLAEDVAALQVRVGDLAGMRQLGGGPWNVGVVRWLRAGDDGRPEMGLQLLAPDASPAFVRNLFAGDEQTWQPAVILSEAPALKQPPLLAAPRGTFQELRKYELDRGGDVRIIRSAKLIEQTGSFDLFQFASA